MSTDHVERFPFIFLGFYSFIIIVLADIHLRQNKQTISNSDKKIASRKWISRIFYLFFLDNSPPYFNNISIFIRTLPNPIFAHMTSNYQNYFWPNIDTMKKMHEG